jgi:cell division septal protein FtsQ
VPGKVRFARSVARVEALRLPSRPAWPQLHPRAALARVTPTRRSLTIGLGILALALGGYLLARETSMFAISRIEVSGGSPRVVRQVHGALAPLVGTSLVGLDGAAVLRKVDALPTIVRARYDRAFPHMLRITVVPEQPAAVLRRGSESWLVSVRGRVMENLPSRAGPKLPRIWVSTHTPVQVGGRVATAAATSARAAGLAGRFGSRVASVTDTDGTLEFHLWSGLDVLLGDGADVKLKVAVAQRVLPILATGSTYLDVSNPGRPVSGTGSPTIVPSGSSSRG